MDTMRYPIYAKHADWELSLDILRVVRAKMQTALCLDIGVGEGEKAVFLRGLLPSILGVEVSVKRAKEAKKRGIEVLVADGSHLPFVSSVFDIVTGFHVMEHVEDGRSFIKEISRTLKINGFFLLVTPNRIRLTSVLSIPLRLFLRKRYPFNPEHIMEYTWEDTLDLVRATGLRSCRVEGLFLGVMTNIWGLRVEIGMRTPPALLRRFCSQLVIYGYNLQESF